MYFNTAKPPINEINSTAPKMSIHGARPRQRQDQALYEINANF